MQRPTADLPVVHLEAGIPAEDDWTVCLDGLVNQPMEWSAEELRSLPPQERVWDLNCVWGWVRPDCRWHGIPACNLIDAAGPLPGAAFVVAQAAGGGPGPGSPRLYESCLTLEEAGESLIAWKLDGTDLLPQHGGPFRLVPPPGKWGYKGVKWLKRLTLLSDFRPGFWEEMVGNPAGDIPAELLDQRFE